MATEYRLKFRREYVTISILAHKAVEPSRPPPLLSRALRLPFWGGAVPVNEESKGSVVYGTEKTGTRQTADG